MEIYDREDWQPALSIALAALVSGLDASRGFEADAIAAAEARDRIESDRALVAAAAAERAAEAARAVVKAIDDAIAAAGSAAVEINAAMPPWRAAV